MVAVLRYHQDSRPLFTDDCGQPALNFLLIFFACSARLADPVVDYLDAEYRHIMGVA
jgi:hypothetical protein